MKNKTLKYLLISVVTVLSLSLTACSKEPVNETIATTEESTTESTEEPSEETTEAPAEEPSTTESTEELSEETTTTESSDGVFNNPYANYTKNDPSLEGYEVTITETLDTQMYVIKESDLYKLDNEKAGKINVMEYGIYVTATGKTSNGWYEVLWGTTKGYLPADVLSTENPLQPIDMNEVNPETGKTTQENLDAFYDAMNDPEFQAELEEEIGPAPSEPIPDGGIAPDYGKIPW